MATYNLCIVSHLCGKFALSELFRKNIYIKFYVTLLDKHIRGLPLNPGKTSFEQSLPRHFSNELVPNC